MLGFAWLDASDSVYELEINYSVSACCECFLHAHFTSASTRTQLGMLKILVLNGLDPEHATHECDIALNLYCTKIKNCS